MHLFSSLKNIIFILYFGYSTLDNQDLVKKIWKRLRDNLKIYSSSRAESKLSKYPSCCIFEKLVDEQLNEVLFTTLTKYELSSLVYNKMYRKVLAYERKMRTLRPPEQTMLQVSPNEKTYYEETTDV